MKHLTEQNTDELDPGCKLADGAYEIVKATAATPSGFNYDAVDTDGNPVVVREFYLRDICQRDGLILHFNTSADKKLFQKLVRGFVRDAQFLESLKNKHVAHVSNVFEENQTAYMVTDPPAGRTIEQLMKDGRKFKPAEIARIANNACRALVEVHAFGMLHRDVSPKNLLMANDGNIVLLPDFGTFREDKTRMSRVVSSVLRAKSVHAPLEFIFDGNEQNEASDLYCLASVLYTLITGASPVACQDRLSKVAEGEEDPYVSLEKTVSTFEKQFLLAIDMALALLNEDRIRTATEFLLFSSKESQPEQLSQMRSDAFARKPKEKGIFGFFSLFSFFSRFRK